MGRGYSLPMSFENSMNIDVYGKPSCPWCDRVKILLEGNGYSFTYRDIAADAAVYDEFMERTGMARSVPQVLVGDTLIGGFEATLEAIKSGRFQQLAGGA